MTAANCDYCTMFSLCLCVHCALGALQRNIFSIISVGLTIQLACLPGQRNGSRVDDVKT